MKRARDAARLKRRKPSPYGAAFERWHRKNCPTLSFGPGEKERETCTDVELRDGPAGLVLDPWNEGMLSPDIERRFWGKSCMTVYGETKVQNSRSRGGRRGR